ncbi:MAG: purine-nucleoside phosphorylase [Candidatus Izemoplasmatales bacterium]|nr:purine-nucleoside phosphorylase [bacterium]MDZ4196669.1 purine-nucleoside phosphorylase [Candidatus Izemoplasmatales bacterium]
MEYQHIMEAAQYILSIVKTNATIGLVLGSGLGSLTTKLTEATSIPFASIPHFTTPSVQGHRGELVIGKLNNVDVIALSGRYHFYEGYPLDQVVLPIRVLKLLGVQTLILSNACGAINETFRPGQLMLIRDHLNMVGINPLIGKNIDSLGPRFPDASEIYSKKLRQLAKDIAFFQEISVKEGVYAWWSGPSYETPAEIKMLRILGADAVGMSTVPESLTASHMGMDVLGISCLTNMASGILDQKLSHEEVIKVASSVKETFQKYIEEIVKQL